jgi:type VI secretion system protein ImpJ
MFEVQRCELLTLHGTLLCFQSDAQPSNARIEPRSFETALEPGGRPLGVYLGVKRLQWEESNVSTAPQGNGSERGAGQPRRYSLQEGEVPDLFAADGQRCALQYLMHTVQVFFDSDASVQTSDYELVKIAEVSRAAEGRGALLSRQYIPPVLSVQASPVLAGMLRDMRELLTAKGRDLTAYKQQRHIQTMDMGSRDMGYLLMMQMVNRYIPLWHHYLEVEETHPCMFYVLLRQMIGEFSTFSETVSVLGGPLPAYRHDRLWECFNAAVRVARALLEELTREPEYIVFLNFDGEYFSGNIEKRFFDVYNHYYLAVRGNLPPRALEQLLNGVGKVCAREEMSRLRQSALPGVTVRYLESPPGGLPQRPAWSYFELDHRGTLWQRIEECQNMAVYCRHEQLPPEGTEMQLLVLNT